MERRATRRNTGDVGADQVWRSFGAAAYNCNGGEVGASSKMILARSVRRTRAGDARLAKLE
jgi:hypothetical protein